MQNKLIQVFGDVVLAKLKSTKSKKAKTTHDLVHLVLGLLEGDKLDPYKLLTIVKECNLSKEEKAQIKELLDNK